MPGKSGVVLGQAGTRKVSIDLDVLLRTRLLVQANSGGGKSWLLRRLAEQLFGRVPVILLDPEGEFATLRERYGYVLVGHGGETPADTRSAALVATKLLELHASAVCDLYEMKPSERHVWVRLFLEALIDAPKKLWQPLVVIVDESHLFAPEKGAGESEAADAMMSLATRGRKRGFCAVWATQRLAKVRKDAAAELQNVLIGSTFIDVDRERAADALGIPRADKPAFFDQIRMLEEGHFFALGRAISTERLLVHIGPVQTTHPEPGSAKHAAEPPPAPEKVRALLPKLADLPQQAEAKAKTEAELRQEIRALRAELTRAKAAPHTARAATPRAKPVPALTERQVSRLTAKLDAVKGALAGWQRAMSQAAASLQTALAPLQRVLDAFRVPPLPGQVVRPGEVLHGVVQFPPRPPGSVPPSQRTPTKPPATGGALGGPERKLLTVLAQHGTRSVRQLALQAGYAMGGGAFRNPLGRLRSSGYVRPGDPVAITEEGLAALGPYEPLPTGRDLLEHWLAHLGGPEGKLLRALADVYPSSLPVAELARRTHYEAGGGAFRNPLGRLRTLQLVEGRGEVRLARELAE